MKEGKCCKTCKHLLHYSEQSTWFSFQELVPCSQENTNTSIPYIAKEIKTINTIKVSIEYCFKCDKYSNIVITDSSGRFNG